MKNLLMVHLHPSAVEPHNQSARIQSSRCGENASSTRYKRLRVAVGTDFFFLVLIILRIKPLTKHSNWCTVHRVTYWLVYWPHRSATVICDLYKEIFFFFFLTSQSAPSVQSEPVRGHFSLLSHKGLVRRYWHENEIENAAVVVVVVQLIKVVFFIC